MDFECHITIARADRERAESVAIRNGFHMSAIEGDEVMGPEARAYCTKSSNSFETLRDDMGLLCDLLKLRGIKVQRKKIEAILIDVRF